MALTGWSKKFELQIDNANIDSNLSDFPVYIDENVPGLPSDFFTTSESDGGDIRASSDSAGNTQLPLEIENFDTTNSKCSIWVKIPSVNSSSNTSFYIWYDKDGESQPAEDSTYGSENVWNSNYKAVFHMTGTGGLTDSTSNDVDMTEQGTVAEADGKLGKCREEDADFNYFDNTTSSALNDLLVNGGTLTTWFWLNSAASGTNIPGLFMGDWGEPFQVYLNGTNNSIIANYYDGSDQIETQSNNNAFSDATWVHLAVRLRNTSGSDYQLEMFVNGQELSSYSSQGTGSNAVSGSADIRLGANNWADWPYTFEGKIDQVTANNTTLSDAWIKAEYTNQNDTTDFFATIASDNEVQLEETLPGLSISINGESDSTNNAAINTSLPPLNINVDLVQNNETSIDNTLPPISINVTAVQGNNVELSSTLPALTIDMDVTQKNNSTVGFSLPAIVSDFSSKQKNNSNVNVNLPALQSNFITESKNQVNINALLPSVNVQVLIEQKQECSLSNSLPSLQVGISCKSGNNTSINASLPGLQIEINTINPKTINGAFVKSESSVFLGNLLHDLITVNGKKIKESNKLFSGLFSLGGLTVAGEKISNDNIIFAGRLLIASDTLINGELILNNNRFFVGTFKDGTTGSGFTMPDLVTRQEAMDHLRIEDDNISFEMYDLDLKISGASAAVLDFIEMDIEDFELDSDNEYIIPYQVKVATLMLIGELHRFRDGGSPNYKAGNLPAAVQSFLFPVKTFGLDADDYDV